MIIKTIVRPITCLILAGSALFSCTYNSDEEAMLSTCEILNPTFGDDIIQIVESNCQTSLACHAAGSINGPGPLTTYEQISTASDRIKQAVETRRMPRGSSLSEENIQKIVCWIESGSPNN